MKKLLLLQLHTATLVATITHKPTKTKNPPNRNPIKRLTAETEPINFFFPKHFCSVSVLLFQPVFDCLFLSVWLRGSNGRLNP